MTLSLCSVLISGSCSGQQATENKENTEKMEIQAKVFNTLTVEEKEFYERLYGLAAKGELDSVKNIVETNNVDFSKYDNLENHYSVLYATAWTGNVALAQYLIDKGANVNAQASGGETALHRAAWNGYTDMVKLLVEKGADVNVIYNANGGLSVLSCAAESGNIETVKYLIEKGADINYTNKDSGSSPLRSAAYKAHYDIFLLLAQMQPKNYNWQNALLYGIIGGNVDIVKYVVEEKRAKVNKHSEYWDAYPIEVAVNNWIVSNVNAQPDVEVVKYLISKGAKLKKINKGRNIFNWAMEEYCSDAMMAFLVEQGVKVKMRTPVSGDWTPLPLALDDSKFALAKILLKRTKDYTFRGSPFIVFFADGMYNSPEIMTFLIKEGINKEYYTEAFVRSVANGDSASAHLLLDAGADILTTTVGVDGANEDGCNVLCYATSYPVAKLLIEKGADIHNKAMLEKAWQSPPLLHALEEVSVLPVISSVNLGVMLAEAAQTGDIRTVEYALKRGADVNYYPLVPASEEESNSWRKPVYMQTPLIKNAIQGYQQCTYDYDNKIQISPRVAEILLNAGANPNIADAEGKTALHHAAGEQQCRAGIGAIPLGNRRQREHGIDRKSTRLNSSH